MVVPFSRDRVYVVVSGPGGPALVSVGRSGDVTRERVLPGHDARSHVLLDVDGGRVAWMRAEGGALVADAGAGDVVVGDATPDTAIGLVDGLWAWTGADGAVRLEDGTVVEIPDGVVAWRVAFPDHAVTITAAGRAWMWVPYASALLAIDPETGQLSRATAFLGEGTWSLREEDVRHGELWVTGSAWERPSELPWALVDLRSGEVRATNGSMAPVDATAPVREALGLTGPAP